MLHSQTHLVAAMIFLTLASVALAHRSLPDGVTCGNQSRKSTLRRVRFDRRSASRGLVCLLFSFCPHAYPLLAREVYDPGNCDHDPEHGHLLRYDAHSDVPEHTVVFTSNLRVLLRHISLFTSLVSTTMEFLALFS